MNFVKEQKPLIDLNNFFLSQTIDEFLIYFNIEEEEEEEEIINPKFPFFKKDKKNIFEISRLDVSQKLEEIEEKPKIQFSLEYEISKEKYNNAIIIILKSIQYVFIIKEDINKEIFIGLYSFILKDPLAKKPKLGCPLTLVKSHIYEENKSKEDDSTLIYKQQVYDSQQKYDLKFKDYLQVINKENLLNAKILFINNNNKNQKINNYLNLDIKILGIIIRHEIFISTLNRLQNFFNKKEENLVAKSLKKDNERKNSPFNLDIELTFNLNNTGIDIFPYYTQKYVAENPNAFDFKLSDIDLTKTGAFYTNERSLLMIGNLSFKKFINLDQIINQENYDFDFNFGKKSINNLIFIFRIYLLKKKIVCNIS